MGRSITIYFSRPPREDALLHAMRQVYEHAFADAVESQHISITGQSRESWGRISWGPSVDKYARIDAQICRNPPEGIGVHLEYSTESDFKILVALITGIDREVTAVNMWGQVAMLPQVVGFLNDRFDWLHYGEQIRRVNAVCLFCRLPPKSAISEMLIRAFGKPDALCNEHNATSVGMDITPSSAWIRVSWGDTAEKFVMDVQEAPTRPGEHPLLLSFSNNTTISNLLLEFQSREPNLVIMNDNGATERVDVLLEKPVTGNRWFSEYSH